MIPNRSLAELCHDALVAAAERKVAATFARKLAERTYDRVFLTTDGRTVDERKSVARLEPKFIAAEDAAIEAESTAIVAKAKADGLQIEFEAWRSKQATDRAEMTLR